MGNSNNVPPLSASCNHPKTGEQNNRTTGKNAPATADVGSDRDGDASPKLGDTVVLKRGQGEKRMYNESEATVIAYPANGDMMTVFVKPKKMKWGKRDCVLPLPELKEEVLVAIFRFLGSPDEKESSNGKEEELLWVRDAVKVHTQLASVCQSWRIISNRNLSDVLGRLNANFDALATETIVPVSQWLIKHKLVIGSLRFDAELEDLALLVQLLTECDTTKLTIVRAYVDKNYRRWTYKVSEWISAAYQAREGQGLFFDLTNGSQDVSFEGKAKYLGAPVREMTQMAFHDILATQCPNLSDLSLNVTMIVHEEERVSCSEYLSSALFSLSSVTKLEVGLSCPLNARSSWPINGMVFYKMIKNLAGITELCIKTKRSSGLLHGRRFLIMSPTLKILDTTGLGKAVWVSCFECPKLERFKCNGTPYGNGTRPLFTADDLVNMDSFEKRFVKDGDLKVNAGGRVGFAGLDVPYTCECILCDFYNPNPDWVLEASRNAKFEHW